jgi:predicted transposase/invertase (TIGR01784 family)
MSSNRNYKDSLFRHLFNNEDELLKLFNGVMGTDYNDSSAITINTLDYVFSMGLKNDISFEIYDMQVLIEHQSTSNENMPLRMYLYLARIIEKKTGDKPKAIFAKHLFEIPYPVFWVFYNGTEEFPKEKILKLSASYKRWDGEKIFLDLEVRVININKGVNPELESRCKPLADYASFVAKVREYEKTHTLQEAIKKAIEYCIENDILKEYLIEKSSEVINMLTAEFNMDEALKVARWEGLEEGIEKGMEKGMQKGKKEGQDYVLKLMAQGLTYEEIKKKIEQAKTRKQ